MPIPLTDAPPVVTHELDHLLDDSAECESSTEHDCTGTATWQAHGVDECLMPSILWCDARHALWLHERERDLYCVGCWKHRKVHHSCREWVANPV